MTRDAAQKFDSARATEYLTQSRIALAGYEACHELAVCMLAATLGSGKAAHILVAGAGGGGQEIVTAAGPEPGWRFTAVDPSAAMLELTKVRLKEHGLLNRTEIRLGYVDDLPAQIQFDAAILIGVLHHLPGDETKRMILRSVAGRLKPGAPLILAGNRYAYSSKPLFLAAWRERWRMKGASPDEVAAKLSKILEGADPPHSDEAVEILLEGAGFEQPVQFFSSLFWAAWLACRTASVMPRNQQ